MAKPLFNILGNYATVLKAVREEWEDSPFIFYHLHYYCIICSFIGENNRIFRKNMDRYNEKKKQKKLIKRKEGDKWILLRNMEKN